jgi:DNA-binding transcriptional LysR family regulator
MAFNQIRYFLNLADTLNFTEAAMRSGVSAPTLTHAIQRLEQELGGTPFIPMEKIVDNCARPRHPIRIR